MTLTQPPFEWMGELRNPPIFAGEPHRWFKMRFSSLDDSSAFESQYAVDLMRRAHSVLQPDFAFAGPEAEVIPALLSGSIDRHWPVRMSPDGTLIAAGATPFVSI